MGGARLGVPVARVALGVFLLVFGLAGAAADPGASVPQLTEKRFQEKASEAKRRELNWRSPSISQPSKGSVSSKALFVLDAVVVEGATAFSKEELAASYRHFLKKSVSERDLLAIVEGITQRYHERGFTLSRAILVPQDVHNGRLRVRVLEGRIEDIVLKGEGVERFGARRLLEPVIAEGPLRLATLERSLLLVNDTPGVRATDVTIEEIGELSGRFRLTVHLETWRLWTGVDIDNRGSQAIGPLQTFSSTAFNSFLIGGDTLTINLATTPNDLREFRFGGAVLDLPVGPDGSRIGLTASYSDIWPDDYRRPLRGHIETEYYALSGTVVSFRSRESSLWLTALAALRNADETSSASSVYHDRIRFIGLDGVYLGRNAENSATQLAVGLRYGTGLLGASERGDPFLSRADGSSEFAKVLATVTHLRRLSEQWSLLFTGSSQVASAPLLASEEFYLGGSTYGRAFLSGELSGDSGVAGLVEVRFDQVIQSPLVKGYQLFAFADSGLVWDRGGGIADRTALSSFGGGVRLSFQDGLRASFEVASPLGDHPASDGESGARFFFTLSKAFKSCSSRNLPLCF